MCESVSSLFQRRKGTPGSRRISMCPLNRYADSTRFIKSRVCSEGPAWHRQRLEGFLSFLPSCSLTPNFSPSISTSLNGEELSHSEASLICNQSPQLISSFFFFFLSNSPSSHSLRTVNFLYTYHNRSFFQSSEFSPDTVYRIGNINPSVAGARGSTIIEITPTPGEYQIEVSDAPIIVSVVCRSRGTTSGIDRAAGKTRRNNESPIYQPRAATIPAPEYLVSLGFGVGVDGLELGGHRRIIVKFRSKGPADILKTTAARSTHPTGLSSSSKSTTIYLLLGTKGPIGTRSFPIDDKYLPPPFLFFFYTLCSFLLPPPFLRNIPTF